MFLNALVPIPGTLFLRGSVPEDLFVGHISRGLFDSLEVFYWWLFLLGSYSRGHIPGDTYPGRPLSGGHITEGLIPEEALTEGL